MYIFTFLSLMVVSIAAKCSDIVIYNEQYDITKFSCEEGNFQQSVIFQPEEGYSKFFGFTYYRLANQFEGIVDLKNQNIDALKGFSSNEEDIMVFDQEEDGLHYVLNANKFKKLLDILYKAKLISTSNWGQVSEKIQKLLLEYLPEPSLERFVPLL